MKQYVRCALALVLCVALSLSGVLVGVPAARAADTGAWTQLPLTAYGISSMAINPLAPSILYVGMNGGGDGSVFRSTNSGTNWMSVGSNWKQEGITSLAINPLAPSTLYVGTYGGGLFRSTDSGTTWITAATGLTNMHITSLAINSLTPSTLYAGTSGGVFRSTNSGDTWTSGLAGQNVYHLVINPITPSTLYVGTFAGGVFRSLDSGSTWSAVNTGLTSRCISALAINALIPSTLYVGTGYDGVFYSTDSGGTWTTMNTGLTKNQWPYALVTNPSNGVLYVGTELGLFRYDDAAAARSCTLTALASPSVGGSISMSPYATSYACGTVVVLTAIPATGYVFTGWSGALTGTKNPATVTMDADKNVTASFAVKVKSVIQLKIGSRTMHVDGSPVVLEAAPIILNSRTLLPIRAVVEATGGTIAWAASTQKVTIMRKGRTLELWIGRNVATLNGQSVNIDSDPKVIPIIMSGRTLLPLRFVAEALALDVQWDAATQMITITYTP